MPETLRQRASFGSSWLAAAALATGVALAIIAFLPASRRDGGPHEVFVTLFLIGLLLTTAASGLATYDMAKLVVNRTPAMWIAVIAAAVAGYALPQPPGGDLRGLTLYIVAIGLAWVALRRTAAAALFLGTAGAGALAWTATALLWTGVAI